MPITSQLVANLASLAERAAGTKPDLRAALGVLGDIGRLVGRGGADDIRTAQAAVAAVRERLDGTEVPTNAAAALRGESSHVFLAGAMWAANELMTARLDAIEIATTAPVRQTRKSEVEAIVLRQLSEKSGTSPAGIRGSAEGKEAELQKYEVSKALSDLMARDLVVTVAAGSEADRRHRYFALTGLGTAAQVTHRRHGAQDVSRRFQEEAQQVLGHIRSVGRRIAKHD